MAKTTKKSTNKSKNISSSTMAKSDDGTIQLTLIIPFSDIKTKQEETLKELAEQVEVPGFRKGKAPLSKVAEKIPQNTLVEKSLQKILPKTFADAIKKHKINPTVYPKFELVKANPNEDWQIRAITCEFPDIDLGNYKKAVADVVKSESIWTPDKGDPDKAKDTKPTKEELEQKVFKVLLEQTKIKIPKVLVDEEINSRLSKLLERIEKLGLTLEGYLASLGKTVDQLREEYRAQAENSIKLDFILIKIAELEKINVSDTEIDSAIAVSGNADPKLAQQLNTPEQRRIIETILKRRKVLDLLTS